MTRTEHLLVILMEECAEVAHRASKALRFGLTEIQPGQPWTNAQRVSQELVDLSVAVEMLADSVDNDEFRSGDDNACQLARLAKRRKVETYLRFSAGRGLVDGVPSVRVRRHPEAV